MIQLTEPRLFPEIISFSTVTIMHEFHSDHGHSRSCAIFHVGFKLQPINFCSVFLQKNS